MVSIQPELPVMRCTRQATAIAALAQVGEFTIRIAPDYARAPVAV